ncbi:MAG: hypothetical protein HUJ76_11605, partial [Parasporobacterium sp.]|nr:hypothetical protein [Parasporobacterium sp.]
AGSPEASAIGNFGGSGGKNSDDQDASNQTGSRNACIIETMEELGIMIWESEGSLYIEGYTGRDPLSGGAVDSGNDPYIAMMEGIAGCISSSPVVIEQAEAAEAVYPDFYEDLFSLAECKA